MRQVSTPKSEIPSWHRKAQKAYRLNRIIILLQVIAAFVMCGVILYGVEKVAY
ncbi:MULTISPECIES: hypothetical protein [unclassified Fibrobacter]|uniref:hypothetical protein n=1 Tax=unclassified Fibrobacter TaxID=2634177 RepID=UPI0015634EC2|nr:MULTISPECIES: hypothetical protein [unclassified Fibrobacter]